MRSAFQGWVPKTMKRESGNADASLVPAHIRVLHSRLSKEERDNIRKKLDRKLGKVPAYHREGKPPVDGRERSARRHRSGVPSQGGTQPSSKRRRRDTERRSQDGLRLSGITN
jgi:hypothetical protein